jgi:hypothetical protein
MGFMMQIRPEVLKKLREDYPIGCRVELVQMFEEPRKDMVPGLTGEVMFVDDAAAFMLPGRTARPSRRSTASTSSAESTDHNQPPRATRQKVAFDVFGGIPCRTISLNGVDCRYLRHPLYGAAPITIPAERQHPVQCARQTGSLTQAEGETARRYDPDSHLLYL